MRFKDFLRFLVRCTRIIQAGFNRFGGANENCDYYRGVQSTRCSHNWFFFSIAWDTRKRISLFFYRSRWKNRKFTSHESAIFRQQSWRKEFQRFNLPLRCGLDYLISSSSSSFWLLNLIDSLDFFSPFRPINLRVSCGCAIFRITQAPRLAKKKAFPIATREY